MKRHMNYLTKTLLFAGVLAVVAGCGNSQKKVQEGNAEAAHAPVQATRVTVTSAVMQDVPQTETYMIQELHLPVYHCLCLMLEDHFFG